MTSVHISPYNLNIDALIQENNIKHRFVLLFNVSRFQRCHARIARNAVPTCKSNRLALENFNLKYSDTRNNVRDRGTRGNTSRCCKPRRPRWKRCSICAQITTIGLGDRRRRQQDTRFWSTARNL